MKGDKRKIKKFEMKGFFMKFQYKNRLVLLFVLIIGSSLHCANDQEQKVTSGNFDIMSDLSYPLNPVQSVRYQIGQALYSVSQQDYAHTISLLEQVIAGLEHRQHLNQDDVLFIKAMMTKMMAIIEPLELSQYRSSMVSLVEQIQSRVA